MTHEKVGERIRRKGGGDFKIHRVESVGEKRRGGRGGIRIWAAQGVEPPLFLSLPHAIWSWGSAGRVGRGEKC